MSLVTNGRVNRAGLNQPPASRNGMFDCGSDFRITACLSRAVCDRNKTGAVITQPQASLQLGLQPQGNPEDQDEKDFKGVAVLNFFRTRPLMSKYKVVLFEEAVLGVLAHRPYVAQALERVLATDASFTAAHALKGLAAIVLARGELLAPAAAALHSARLGLAARGGTAGEQYLVDTLAQAVEGRLEQAVIRLDARLACAPEDLLAIKLAHSFRFMLGDTAGMLGTSNAILPAWSASQAGYGFVLGCHAFALEENGELAAAETVGRAALHHQPDDAWALHAVAHVHEVTGHIQRGIAWLEAARPVWTRCNNFSFHMAWHLALFHLEQGCHDLVLDLYDAEVRPQPTDDFRDVANAVSLLWRLEQEGVHVGDRWEELRTIARRRRRDTTLMFAALHYLMALVAAGDTTAAGELVEEIGTRARSGAGSRTSPERRWKLSVMQPPTEASG